MSATNTSTPPRIEYLRVRNYRALRNIELRHVKPLTVFVGPNGSGKSTIIDVFAFLSECFTKGLRQAWDKRTRFRELRTRGADGPIVIELKYRERPRSPLITYSLHIDECADGPFVSYEQLRWNRKGRGRPFSFLEFRSGRGSTVSGEVPNEQATRAEEVLSSPEMLAVNTFGQFEKHPRVKAVRDFITGWHLSDLSARDPRGSPEAGPQEHLSQSGDNLANVIQYLRERHQGRLKELIDTLCRRVPRLERIDADVLADGRLLLKVKDAPFDRPILVKYASDGTLKMLAYLVLINDPSPPPLIGIEEPENFLHPSLLFELAEECTQAASHSQLMLTTHSPFFVNALSPDDVWVLYRADDGYTRVRRTADITGINEFINAGAQLGDLWMEGHFGIGDPANG